MAPNDFKAWRAALGLSQQEAADRLGISRGSVENYERGARREDGRRVAIPLTVEWACNAVSLDEAAKRQDIGLVSSAWQERIRQLARLM